MTPIVKIAQTTSTQEFHDKSQKYKLLSRSSLRNPDN